MNAALLGACAAASARANRNSSGPIYIQPEDYYQKDERPIMGMLKIRSNRDMTIIPDLVNDEIDLRFRSALAVNALIRELENLKEDMLKMEDVK